MVNCRLFRKFRTWQIFLVGLLALLKAAEPRIGAEEGWFPFEPKPDPFAQDSLLDLRFLNEHIAGENGFIAVREDQFIHSKTGEPMRFWAVNGPPHGLNGTDLQQCARMLAKHGVNLVRLHGGYFDENGEVEMSKIRHTIDVVEAMKADGIYSHLSIYFPLWITPKPGNPWLKGYDGKTHPFAALFFNPAFQAQYRKWWTALLTTPSPATGKTLVDEPAVAGLEMQNEDSLFFWTFSEQNIPDEELRLLEKMFGDWLVKRYGTISAAFEKWNQLKTKRDVAEENRVGFRPLWNLFNERTRRDKDTALFLLEVQTRFYTETYSFLRKLGFKGPVTASNWATASPEFLGPLEKLSYRCADFIDRHGYLGCNHKGSDSAWSLRNGHTYSDRSALRFDDERPAKLRQFVHPAMDPHYDGKPSMISETTWNRPNRFRSEAPLYLAVFGALQNSDAIVHFALDSKDWAVKPGYWMQPWTLMTPAMMGQFPAAALIYRRGLVATGSTVAEINLNKEAILRLEGTPLPQDASLDELRLKEVPSRTEFKPGQRLDPLLHYTGRVSVNFVDSPTKVKLGNIDQLIDHTAQTVSSTTGELKLDYGKGLLIINAPQAQGFSGCPRALHRIDTKDLSFESEMDLGHVVAVSLDNQPLTTSRKMLLQVMSEEKSSDFQTEPVSEGVKRITNLGKDPWLVKELSGTVAFKRADATELKVRTLDLNGYALENCGTAEKINLRPSTLYYVIEK